MQQKNQKMQQKEHKTAAANSGNVTNQKLLQFEKCNRKENAAKRKMQQPIQKMQKQKSIQKNDAKMFTKKTRVNQKMQQKENCKKQKPDNARKRKEKCSSQFRKHERKMTTIQKMRKHKSRKSRANQKMQEKEKKCNKENQQKKVNNKHDALKSDAFSALFLCFSEKTISRSLQVIEVTSAHMKEEAQTPFLIF